MSDPLAFHFEQARQRLPGWEARDGQEQMCRTIFEAMENGDKLLLEAETGSGKSFAYLLASACSGKRVVISTGTRALQDQLIFGEIPLVEKVLGRSLNVAVLKGVANYVCQRKASIFMATRSNALPMVEEDETHHELTQWLLSTTTGAKTEGPRVSDALWTTLSTTADGRLGASCKFASRCFVGKARRAAEKAEILIVNHSLFFADLALRERDPDAAILPRYDVVVFDEAHLLESLVLRYSGVSVSAMDCRLMVRDLADTLTRADALERFIPTTLPLEIKAATENFFSLVQKSLRDFERQSQQSDVLLQQDVQAAWHELDTTLEQAFFVCDMRHGRESPLADDFASLAQRLTMLRQRFSDIFLPDKGNLPCFEKNGDDLTISMLAGSNHQFAQSLAAKTAIFCSATMTVAKSFSYFRSALALSRDVPAALVGSTFDYQTAAILYVPRALPLPGELEFFHRAAEEIQRLVSITEGSAFVLCASHKSVAMFSKLVQFDGPKWVQGQATPAELLEQFRKNPGSLLFGTQTFWTGVDVPGKALSLVIVEKLPFASPDDPFMKARARPFEEAGEDPFEGLYLPNAVLTFRQGFGRLIRRKDDRGIVAVLDGRLVKKQYGQAFLQSLPERLPRTSSLLRVQEWWKA